MRGMNNSFDTSFIPQQPLLKVEGSARRGETINIALIFALIIFFATLIVWGGIYFYKTTVDSRVRASEEILKAKEATLKVEEIDRYKAIADRLAVAKNLLQEHIAFSTVLTLLEKITAQNIGWTAMSYGGTIKEWEFVIRLTGQAPSYSAVYAQAQAWRSMNDTLEKVEVSMPVLDTATGIISFTAALTVEPSYLNYARALKEGAVAGDKDAASVPAPLSPPASPGSLNSPQTP